jgi:hypothetical protein
MDLFDNLSNSDSSFDSDLDLYELQLVINRQSNSASDPSDHEPLSETEALDIGAIPSPETETSLPEPSKKSRFYTIGTHQLALTHKRDGVPISYITLETQMSKSAINRLQAKAISRGWFSDPVNKQIVKPYYIDDAIYSGRPKISIATTELILKIILKNSITRR